MHIPLLSPPSFFCISLSLPFSRSFSAYPSPFPLLFVNLKLQALWDACMMWASVKWWIFFSFHSPFFFPCVSYLLLACVAEGLDNLFIQVSANKHNIFSLLCIAETLDLEALVLIVGGRGIEHQNVQTRKIFSCFLRRMDFFGITNKLE